MDKKCRKGLITGTRGYKHEKEISKRIIRKHKKLSSHEFDRIFGDFDHKNLKYGTTIQQPSRIRLRFLSANRNTIILGHLSPGYWEKWMDLTQIMILLDIVEVNLEGDGLMYYKLTGKESD